MTTIALRPASGLLSAASGSARCLWLSAKLGLGTFAAAPLIVALAVIPEFAQHVAEVKLGMFESKDAFRALANDPTRWAFGYAKIAGLVAAMLLTARFWATGSVPRAVLATPREIARLVAAILLLIGSAEALNWLGERSGSELVTGLLTAIMWISQAVLMVMVAGALLGDGEGWRRNLTARLPTALLMTAIAAILFVPLQILHSANHDWAFGQPVAIVWALMIFDSLLVGLMATVVGAVLFVAYRAGPSWRGWARDPRTIG